MLRRVFAVRSRRRLVPVLAAVPLVLAGLAWMPASASSVTSAVFTGGTGTASVGGVLYAKQGGQVTLTVKASNDTQCVDVAGAFTGHDSSATAHSTWTFSTTAGSGDGTQAVTITASRDVNANKNPTQCTGPSGSLQASYVLDNTGPVVSGSVSPAPNADGWNKSAATITWSATDAGSGVASGPTPASTVVTGDGVTTQTSTATDRLGNTGDGSVTVRMDGTRPTIAGAVTAGTAGQDGWYTTPVTVTFTCADDAEGSGVKSCLADGSATNSIQTSSTGSVTGNATDKAGNTETGEVAVKIDTTGPALSGIPTTAPNAEGWYRGDVGVHWTATDAESGIPTPPADTTITGEGTSLTNTTSVSNGAGTVTTATSEPAVKIDRTAPTTAITGAPSNAWTNGSVTLDLASSDNLSGVDQTFYAVDGGPSTAGASLSLSDEGDHTVEFWSVDEAGNVETAHTAHVGIDKTAPTIGHAFSPVGYHDAAWTNTPVTVSFVCGDQGGSGLASCTGDAARSTEGVHTVTGSATDNAGNTATDDAVVRIDLTKPVIHASASGTPSDDGWYAEDVTVSYECTDALSGIATCPTPDTLGEGADQSASGTAVDRAGNTGSDSLTGIDVDKTKPVLTADYSTAWHSDDVTVHWSCTDALSGVATGPDDDTVTGEGSNLSSSASCTDKAGNTATKTVDGIRIDRHAPITTASYADAPGSGWYTSGVEVTLNGADNLSGVETTTYSVDGGDPKTYDAPFTVTGDGHHVVRFHSVDAAGNVEEEPAPVDLAIDGTAPTTRVIEPISTSPDWYVTSGIPFAFDANDNTDGSGVAATYFTVDGGDPETYGEPFTRDLSDGPHTVTYWSVDAAGNDEEHGTFDINVDTVKPTITARQAPAANGFGWNNTDVTVSFDCSDPAPGSGIASCSDPMPVTNEGEDQAVSGSAVDVAGNSSHTTWHVNIDKTAPSLIGTPEVANAAGWHHDDVTVHWSADDALSGIDGSTVPDDSVVTGEGRDLEAIGSVSDNAGNVTQSTVSGLKVDRHGPTVTGKPTSEPNAAGWFSGAVVVDWTCADPDLADGSTGSGVAACPTSSVISGDGIGKSATSGVPTDIAGNEGSRGSVQGIDIDGAAPVSEADNRCVKVNDWCTGDTAQVELDASDNLSGVQEIHYRVNDGAEQVAAGSSTTASVPLTGSGSGTVTYWAVDRAGNVERANAVSLKWDNISPAVSHALDPAANAEGWNNSDVTVTFSAKDEDQGSGVASVSDPVTVSVETSGRDVTGTATDLAGNVGVDTVTVKLDKTKPTITGAITDGTLGGDGWYVGPVTVTFTCADGGSGVVACPDSVVLTENGTGQSATGTVRDMAGNQASATSVPVKIDREKPTFTGVNVRDGSYTLGSVPKATCTASDGYSGIASCTVAVTGGTANGVGTFTWTATANDKAGNVATSTGTYKVGYRFDGFLQPINDTAHQVGVGTSIFKAGSTVPVKLVLRDAAGNTVQPTRAPEWLTPVRGSSTSAPVDESLYSMSADSGTAYRSDGGQWIYNWKTPSGGGSYWRIGVALDDGTTYFVNIGLR